MTNRAKLDRQLSSLGRPTFGVFVSAEQIGS
jgi:hypothetical protein